MIVSDLSFANANYLPSHMFRHDKLYCYPFSAHLQGATGCKFGKGDLNEDCFSKQRDVFMIPARNQGAAELLIKIKNKWYVWGVKC